MSNASTVKAPVLIPFVCPVCTGHNAVELVALSRAGGMDCVKCGKHLRSSDVARAMHAPRDAKGEPPRMRARPQAAEKPKMVWPPTRESRAAIAPARRDRSGDRN